MLQKLDSEIREYVTAITGLAASTKFVASVASSRCRILCRAISPVVGVMRSRVR